MIQRIWERLKLIAVDPEYDAWIAEIELREWEERRERERRG